MSPAAHMVARYRFWRAELVQGCAPLALVDDCEARLREWATHLIAQFSFPLPASAVQPAQGELWG